MNKDTNIGGKETIRKHEDIVMIKFYYDLRTKYVYKDGNLYIDNKDIIEEIEDKEVRQDVIELKLIRKS